MKVKTTRKVLMSACLADMQMTQQETVDRSFLSPVNLNQYVEIGTAEVEIEFFTPERVKANEVAALRAELEKTRAEFSKRVMQIEDQIAKRLAISNEVTA